MDGHDTLTIIISMNAWDPKTKKFILTEGTKLELKHSLFALRLWEMKWHLPLLKTFEERKITAEQLVDYVRCMTLNKNVNPWAYQALCNEDIIAIYDYMDDPKTATIFADDGKEERNNRFITAELIYAWMLMAHIPFECEKWHLRQLLTLIRTYGEENSTETNKKPESKLALDRARENERRKKLFGTDG